MWHALLPLLKTKFLAHVLTKRPKRMCIEHEYGWRRHIKFHNQRNVIGFIWKRNKFILKVEEGQILSQQTNKIFL